MTTKQGFTLIEILIVIVIIGITVGFALIAFGDFGASKKIMFSADQLANNIRLAQQQAILENSTLGIRIENNSYQILKFNTQWNPISNKGVFKVNYFPKNTVITLKTNNKPVKGTPEIIINSSGDTTPFSISFGSNQDEILTTLTGSRDGTLTFSSAKPK
ncbi:type II secretion system minor pseudopilin GspH [uncultured Legionella sp.]|uniref:type II secretion system minor pseudopilin GspH n=1 Tax=uncultured Legionella sp. TaxID=210934 RepID=UPI00260735B5|nr:type II secretion system minor pseudopilin GspH [uncultured Legionella sp.]